MKKRLEIILTCAVVFVLAAVLIFVFGKPNSSSELLESADAQIKSAVITRTEPSGIVFAHEGQKIKFTVTALSNSKVTVKVGAKKYKTKEKVDSDGYSVYSVNVKMPQSKIEIESLGIIGVTAINAGQAYIADCAKVIYSKSETPSQTQQPQSTMSGTTLTVQNHVLSEDTAKTNTVSQSSTAPSFYTAQTGSSQQSAVTSGQMCVVTEGAADTWPGNDNTDTYIPYYTPLTRGTMDYVVSESEVYDSEEGTMRYFYTLGSGRRVLKKNVSLVQASYADNSISTASYCANGELKLILSESWKVPYTASLEPQQYYSANGKKFNVSSFTASALKFTFYYTVSAVGNIDASGSDIVSSGAWSVDSASKTATLTLPLRKAGMYYGYSAEYDANGNLVITVHNKINSLAGSVILLDPGHGGSDSGALGYNGSIYESQMNFANAVELKNELESRGAAVYLTRYDDLKVTLEERKAMTYSLKPDLYISLHCDGSEDKSIYGTSAYYFKPMSQPLAGAIYDEMSQMYQSYMYSPDKAQNALRGCRYHPFSVTRVEDCPSVLIEVGYITNDEECAKFTNEETRKKTAVAIANGIEKYISQR